MEESVFVCDIYHKKKKLEGIGCKATKFSWKSL